MTALVLTHLDGKRPLTPHLDALRGSNPGADIHVVFDPLSRLSPREAWAHPERLLRRWWIMHGAKTQGDEITVMEWDCRVTVPIPVMPDADLAMARIRELSGVFRRHHLAAWNPPCEPLLGYPFGFFQIRRWLLDRLARHDMAQHFAAPAYCETILPTLARHVGARITEGNWPHVGWRGHIEPTAPGIWHPVKTT